MWSFGSKLKIIIMALFAKTEFYSQEYFSLRFIGTEDKINLEPSDVSASLGLQRIQDGQNYLRLDNQLITSMVVTIPRNQLISLYNEVNIGSQNYITALRVYLACKDSGSPVLDLIFQPVMLDFSHPDENSQTDMYRISFSGQMYNFDSVAKRFVVSTNVSSGIELYKNHFMIKRTSTAANFSKWSIKDPEYTLFPFQLLIELMDNNKNDELSIYSVATLNKEIPAKREFQHALLLHSPNKGGTGYFADKYADRSHLCPPCSGLEFGFLGEEE
jgi:hypothetical protein